MTKLLIALSGAGILLSAGAASAQPYYHDYAHDRAWRDNGGRDRNWRDNDWRWRHRYHYGAPYYGREVCAWRYGERVCWYQR